MKRAFVIALCTARGASADTLQAPSCDAAKPVAKVKTLREVDWCNFDYGGWGPLYKGSSDVHLYADLGGEHDTIDTKLLGVVYGDFDADRRVEAAVVVQTTTWIATVNQPHAKTIVHVYRLAKGVPEKLGDIVAQQPVTGIGFAKGVISITSGSGKSEFTAHYRRVKNDFVKTTK